MDKRSRSDAVGCYYSRNNDLCSEDSDTAAQRMMTSPSALRTVFGSFRDGTPAPHRTTR